MDYKATLNLPQTKFPMKASLTKREPMRLDAWKTNDLYGKIKDASSSKKHYILHDGPPYANGHIHSCHVVNKVLKVIIVKYKTLTGHFVPYVPGWDCHGLPIELRLLKDLKATKNDVDQLDFRKKAHDYALKWVNIQKEEFQKFGIFGEWENPYLTMDPNYEKCIVESFYKIYNSGHVIKGKKPIYWCYDCETALAEAEVEYDNLKAPSIYVRFKLNHNANDFGINSEKPINIVIWTTTPWTLPANKAIAVHPDLEYIFEELDQEIIIIASDLKTSFHKTTSQDEGNILKKVTGKDLEKKTYTHFFTKEELPVILSSFVTTEQGTGCVHTAPGHGQEDFIVGNKYGLPVFSPVDDKGRFDKTSSVFVGEHVFKADSKIVELLKEKNVLVYNEYLDHSYPHCWRCKKPVLFRATDQWFISLEKEGLKEKALDGIKEVTWIPESGESRITGMIKNRPEWCISRQRLWGVPIPVFYCSNCNEVVINKNIQEQVIDKIAAEGTDIWFKKDADFFIPQGTKCPHCENDKFKKEEDILDVWFDSGVSHQAVLKENPLLKFPADLYIEGSDQHRGWFQSALLTAKAVGDETPFKKVLTHGFVVDGDGYKMSKSQGNVIDPLKLMNKYGADILRLWVASMNYFVDIRISDAMLNQISDAYRKIRNTFRFLLGNTFDFDSNIHKVSFENMSEIDLYILSRYEELLKNCSEYYENFEFHKVYRNVYQFCTVDLSSFYLDIMKNKLYTDNADSAKRRSSQTVMTILADGLCKILSPIIPFTTDEVWEYFQKEKDSTSIHITDWPQIEIKKDMTKILEKYRILLELRNSVLIQLEESRNKKIIGSSLQAKVHLSVGEEKMYNFLKEISIQELKELFIVSGVEISKNDKEKELNIQVSNADGSKCTRCWQYSTSVGDDKEHIEICKNCLEVIRKSSNS